MLGAAAIVLGTTHFWDTSTPAERTGFESVDPTVAAAPFTQFLFAALGALAIAGEYGTGMIRTSLVVVPRRRSLVAGKIVVVAGVTLVAGQVLSFALVVISQLIVGDHQVPVSPWTSAGQAYRVAASAGLVIAVSALVGLGLGALIRSVAGTLVALAGLLFVLPIVLSMLPWHWATFVRAATPFNLPSQLSHTAVQQVLTTPQALAALAIYLVAALGAGTVTFLRRDA